ncbi:MAG: ATP-binding cassette domain-containing protein [Planctomycetes bacterium]|nr:ATP-binding cassette domain-containing protein [Planctomycetota bacterium]
MGSAIDVRALERSFGERKALAGVTFDVRAGEIFGLLGPNGGGKTTLFRILATLLPPTRGTATVLGHDVAADSAAVRREIGVVFQATSTDKKLTSLENLVHQGHMYGMSGASLHRRAAELLERFGVADRAGEYTETLSGGLRRRVEIAKGLLHSPRVLLLDEPSAGLDPAARRDLRNVLASLKKDGTTVLITTHFMEEGAMCDRVAILDLGKVVALGKPEALSAESGTDVISIQSRDAEKLKAGIAAKFEVPVSVLDGVVRVERSRGHEFVPQLVESFPGQVEAVTVAKPTLEDVFIRRTGRRFGEER